ncbi:MAG: molybdenum cofactor synthesis domain protein [Clostridia bacterium]|jgi:molybdopterin molybdotransferase|uniref:molybdopterin molybdotransferase MoeA n=1 Tax=Petroclostridium xylanilyticum TaxID=1792311 RepID=UPI000B996EFD|nr:gephyrin-like molybdotransferase Glp [Petroclostridium xylanilyticum]MBZ4646006.1 molybdenum cofactor synthesis domain protein [Clostridia bacterium]
MYHVKSFDDVIKIIHANFSGFELESEVVNIKDAVNRITDDDIVAVEDIPGFNRSSVDGYAVIASDTFGSSEALPVQLKLLGEVKMGEKNYLTIASGQAAYIPTGGELPQNADAVVMIEYSEDMDDGFVYIYKPVAPGNNVVFKGDDVKAGDVVLKSGSSLRPQDIGVLAALGIEKVAVKRKIRVGIVSTGDEVVDIRQQPVGSQVRDVNSYFLYSGLLEYSVEPILYGITADSYKKIKTVVETALEECDVVLISGGSSVGTRDETYKIINSVGDPGVLIHGIAVKPGKPTIIGKSGRKALIGLPGHPVSAFFIFKLLVLRLIDVMNGTTSRPESTVKAVMTVNYPSNNGREEFVPVILKKEGSGFFAEPVFSKSGLIKLLSSADGYVRVERGSEGICKGCEVDVILF